MGIKIGQHMGRPAHVITCIENGYITFDMFFMPSPLGAGGIMFSGCILLEP